MLSVGGAAGLMDTTSNVAGDAAVCAQAAYEAKIIKLVLTVVRPISISFKTQ
jgi:hypothetical protein